MTKKDLIEKINETLAKNMETKHIGKSATGHVLDALADVAADELLGGGEVPLGLGKLKAKQRAACQRRNPGTGEIVDVPARLAVTFAPGKELKQALR